MSTITLTTTQHAMLAHAIHQTEGRIDWFPENIKGGARQKVLQGLFNRALITPLGPGWFVAAEGYDALGCAKLNACTIAPDKELDAAVAQAEASWAQKVNSDAADQEDTNANDSAPATPVDADDVCIQTEIQVSKHDNATNYNEHPTGTDVPARALDAPQSQPEPTLAPADQPLTKVIRTREHSKQATIIGMLQRTEGATIAQICEATGWQAHTVRGTFAGAFKKKLGMTITSDKAEGGVRTYRATD